MVPRLTLRGKALVVYEPQRVKQTTPTLEAVFDLTPRVQREIAETPFSQDTRGIVLSPHVLATVAHALTPNSVEVSVAHQTKAQKAPMPVTNMTLVARTAPGKDGVPAQVAHVNTPYWVCSHDSGHIWEEIFPHPMSERIGAKANYTPHNSEQRKLLGNVEHLTRTAIPGPLVHLDPLRLIEFE